MIDSTSSISTSHISSTPGLAAALRETHTYSFSEATSLIFASDMPVSMYQVSTGDVATEASSAIHLVDEVTERLRRLGGAYGEWSSFDAPAYFDLSEEHCNRLTHLSERVSTVHVTFAIDLLLPSFQAAADYWATRFSPAYHAASPSTHSNRPSEQSGPASSALPQPGSAFVDDFHQVVQPEMVRLWQQLFAVLHKARESLFDDIGFLSMNGGQEERAHWRLQWEQEPAPGLDERLCLPLRSIPTLNLAFEFSLPISRQSDRLQRLRRSQMSRRRRK